jgi:hypothetical protein
MKEIYTNKQPENEVNLNMKKHTPITTTALCRAYVERSKDFKTGKFSLVQGVDGVKRNQPFLYVMTVEIETFEGKTDTASIRWI